MNRSDFLNMMENSASVNRQMIGEIYELIDLFPYFQSAHLLLLKGLHNNSDVKFDNQLRSSAIHIGDREVLYWLLKEPILKDSQEKIEEDFREVSEPQQAGQHSEISEADTQQTVIEAANSETLINNIERDSGELKIKQNDSTGNLSGHRILIAAEADSAEPGEVVFLPDDDTSPAEEKVFFMDPGFSRQSDSDLLELDTDEATFDIDDVPDDKAARELKKLRQSELIDKFIIANPRIEPQKDKSDFVIEDISKPFVEQTDGLVSETLAKIYICQGYYSRAIDIYEKLSLKFPEKSSYFATQIEKVKELLKK